MQFAYIKGIYVSTGVSTVYCINNGDRKYLKAKREERLKDRFLPAVYLATLSKHTIAGAIYGLGCGLLGPFGWATLIHTIVSAEKSIIDYI